MSIETEINSIRREIQNRKITPVPAMNRVSQLMSDVIQKIPNDSIGGLVRDLWSEWYDLAISNAIKHDNIGHGQMFFDAKIQIIGDLISKLDKTIEKQKRLDIPNLV